MSRTQRQGSGRSRTWNAVVLLLCVAIASIATLRAIGAFLPGTSPLTSWLLYGAGFIFAFVPLACISVLSGWIAPARRGNKRRWLWGSFVALAAAAVLWFSLIGTFEDQQLGVLVTMAAGGAFAVLDHQANLLSNPKR